MTFRQALELGANVRKGEKGTLVVYANIAKPRDQMGHSSIKVTFDTYEHLFPGHGNQASARYETSMADARVRHKIGASNSNPLATNDKEGNKP